MARVKRGVAAHARHKKVLKLAKGYRGRAKAAFRVGIEKVGQMCVQFTREELEAFHAVKAAFDPEGLLNPGKAVPTPRHCSEYRLTGTAQGAK